MTPSSTSTSWRPILNAQKELEKLAGEGPIEEVKDVELSPEQKALVKRFAEMHLEIEKDMIQTYQKMAVKMTHPPFKAWLRP